MNTGYSSSFNSGWYSAGYENRCEAKAERGEEQVNCRISAEDIFTESSIQTSSEYGATFSDGVTLTWDELIAGKDRDKYGYDNSYITETEINGSSSGGAFRGCTSLVGITIPESITNINQYAFYGCENLTGSIIIPKNVISIGNYAFYNCKKLNTVSICSGVTSIGSYAFRDCKKITSINIPSSVTNINPYAFYGCTSLTSITIPDSVTNIKDHVFYNCTSLVNVTIPDNITSIGSYAFYNCKKITNVTIPDSVTSIGNNAFGSCKALTGIKVSNGNSNYKSIDGVLFSSDNKLVQYPAGKTDSSYIIPAETTAVNNYAFSSCTNLTSITIPENVTNIGCYAFTSCTSLTSATFKATEGWYIGTAAGRKTTALSSSDLSNTATAATYLKTTYYSKYWSR